MISNKPDILELKTPLPLPFLLWKKRLMILWRDCDSLRHANDSSVNIYSLKLARKTSQNVPDNINLIMKWYTSYNCHFMGEGQIPWQVWIGISLLKSQNCCVTSVWESGPISWAIFVLPLKSIPWRLRQLKKGNDSLLLGYQLSHRILSSLRHLGSTLL